MCHVCFQTVRLRRFGICSQILSKIYIGGSLVVQQPCHDLGNVPLMNQPGESTMSHFWKQLHLYYSCKTNRRENDGGKLSNQPAKHEPELPLWIAGVAPIAHLRRYYAGIEFISACVKR